MKRILTLVSALLLFSAVSGFACSGFVMGEDDYHLIGFNENWFKKMPGMIIKNNRGIEKQSVSWNRLENRAAPDEKRISWISEYGSITFSGLGREFPMYGVNEKGFFVAELYLGKTESPEPDEKATMFWAQWIQYMLDNYESVEDLSEEFSALPIPDWWPDAPGSQVFVADRFGKTGAIKMHDNEMFFIRDEEMPEKLLTNGDYYEDIEKLSKYKGFGGKRPVVHGLAFSFPRFASIADMLRKAEYSDESQAESAAWKILNKNFRGAWQVIINPVSGKIQFRSKLAPEIKEVYISDFDFSPSSDVLWIDINTDIISDTAKAFQVWTHADGLRYSEAGLPFAYYNKKYFRQPIAEVLINNIAGYPLSYE